MSKTTQHTPGPIERAHKMTASPIDHPRHHAYIAGFNDALKLWDAYLEDEGLFSALEDLLKFAEIWQGSSVEIIKARAAIAKAKAKRPVSRDYLQFILDHQPHNQYP